MVDTKLDHDAESKKHLIEFMDSMDKTLNSLIQKTNKDKEIQWDNLFNMLLDFVDTLARRPNNVYSSVELVSYLLLKGYIEARLKIEDPLVHPDAIFTYMCGSVQEKLEFYRNRQDISIEQGGT